MGSLFIFAVIYFVQLFINIFFLRTIARFSKNTWIQKAYKWLSEKLYYGEFIALSQDSYLEFAIAGWLTIHAPLFSTDGEVVSFYVGIYALCVALLIMPSFVAYILYQDINKLQEKEFSIKWSKFYEDLRTDAKSALLYPVVFMGRRLIFVFLVFVMYEYPA